MRFFVRWLDVCPVEEKRTLRKSAFCNPCRTEKRILYEILTERRTLGSSEPPECGFS